MTTIRQRKRKFQHSRRVVTFYFKNMSGAIAKAIGMHGNPAKGWSYSFRPSVRMQLRRRYHKPSEEET